jgi:hypothetical protein
VPGDVGKRLAIVAVVGKPSEEAREILWRFVVPSGCEKGLEEEPLRRGLMEELFNRDIERNYFCGKRLRRM